jgi:hypothetical protein
MENKTGKYLKYAIGEIVLVMIGILLALQVNNWNNNRIEASKEQLLLKNLQTDFKTNLSELKYTYDTSTEAYVACVKLLEIIKDDSSINPSEIESLIDNIINKIRSLDLISGSIDEILNTGSLHIIQDPELRKQLSNWTFYVNDTGDDIQIYTDYLFGILIPSLTEKAILRNTNKPIHFLDDLNLPIISKSGFKIDYNKTIRTLEFENQIYNNALNYMYALNAYKIMETYLNDTLELINDNLK